MYYYFNKKQVIKIHIIMLSKISQTQTNFTCFLSYAESRPKKRKSNVKGGLFGREPAGRERAKR
jgi:hypothetical protein